MKSSEDITLKSTIPWLYTCHLRNIMKTPGSEQAYKVSSYRTCMATFVSVMLSLMIRKDAFPIWYLYLSIPIKNPVYTIEHLFHFVGVTLFSSTSNCSTGKLAMTASLSWWELLYEHLQIIATAASCEIWWCVTLCDTTHYSQDRCTFMYSLRSDTHLVCHTCHTYCDKHTSGLGRLHLDSAQNLVHFGTCHTRCHTMMSLCDDIIFGISKKFVTFWYLSHYVMFVTSVTESASVTICDSMSIFYYFLGF
jgi:hypothetical protein